MNTLLQHGRETIDLVPPLRYSLVEDGVHRGAYPVLRNFPFLRQLRLKMMLALTPEEPTLDLREFCRSERIQVRHIQVDKHKGEPTILPNDVAAALELIVNPDNLPIYVHCLDGRHVAGQVLMALRKLQCWEFSMIYHEYGRFTGESISKDEVSFLGDFLGPVSVPLTIPKWLWGGAWKEDGNKKKHPSIKIKLPGTEPNISQAPKSQTGTQVGAAAASPPQLSDSSPSRSQPETATGVSTMNVIDVEAFHFNWDDITDTVEVDTDIYALGLRTGICGVTLRTKPCEVRSTSLSELSLKRSRSCEFVLGSAAKYDFGPEPNDISPRNAVT